MNLKSLIAVTAVATAGAALAAYESPVKLCQIKVDSAYTNTILALPLVDVGSTTGNTTLNPTNHILTTGLSNGDFLFTSYGRNKMSGWIVSNGQWSPVDNVIYKNINVTAPSSANPSRGTGVWLTRKNPSSPAEVYLYGQIMTNTVEVTPEAGANTQPKYTMMGNPRTSTVDLLQCISGTPSMGDMIALIDDSLGGMSATYVYMSNEWKQKGTPTTDENGVSSPAWNSVSSITLQPGQGFWYISKGSDTPTINWGAGE